MIMLNDYKCSLCDYIEEKWSSEKEIECTFCGGLSTRIISGGFFSLPGIDQGFPTTADKWAKRHRKANRSNLKRLGIPC